MLRLNSDGTPRIGAVHHQLHYQGGPVPDWLSVNMSSPSSTVTESIGKGGHLVLTPGASAGGRTITLFTDDLDATGLVCARLRMAYMRVGEINQARQGIQTYNDTSGSLVGGVAYGKLSASAGPYMLTSKEGVHRYWAGNSVYQAQTESVLDQSLWILPEDGYAYAGLADERSECFDDPQGTFMMLGGMFRGRMQFQWNSPITNNDRVRLYRITLDSWYR